MKTASVSELKAHLSRFLRDVRRGGEVQVLDRGVPVARLMPVRGPGVRGEERARRERLVAAGVVRPGTGEASAVLELPPLELATSLSAALAEEREDRA